MLASLAQLVAHRTCNAGVRGSSPLGSSGVSMDLTGASNFETFVALKAARLDDQLAFAIAAGACDQLTESVLALLKTEFSLHWGGIAEAIADYPAIGLREITQIVNQAGADRFLSAVVSLVNKLRDLYAETDLNSIGHGLAWQVPKFVSLPAESFWSSMPQRSVVSIRNINGQSLWDDFMAPSANEPVVLSERPTMDGKLLELHSTQDWLGLVTQFPKAIKFASAPSDSLIGDFVVPDWSQIARHYDAVFLSLGCYLQTAYRSLPIENSGKKTMLAGWQPASIIKFLPG